MDFTPSGLMLAGKGGFAWPDMRSWAANVLLRPLLFIVVFQMIHRSVLTHDYGGRLELNLAFYGAVVTHISCVSVGARRDQEVGVLAYSVSTRQGYGGLPFARAVYAIPHACVSLVAGLGYARLTTHAPLGSPAILVVAAACCMLTGACLAVLASAGDAGDLRLDWACSGP